MTKYSVDVVIHIKQTLEIEVSENDLSNFTNIVEAYRLKENRVEDIAVMKAIHQIRTMDLWQDSMGDYPNNTFEISKPKLKSTMHQWTYLQKEHQRAMGERICKCGAHVKGPSCAGIEGECPQKIPCDCKRDGCPSNI